jgi:riboflavin synthase
MFTGIVFGRGSIVRARRRNGLLILEIKTSAARKLRRGDSISVNGVCLTATHAGRRRFTVTAMSETLARTTLGGLRKGDEVNLELPVRPKDRLGGHLVQGHVDGIADVARFDLDGGSRILWLECHDDLLRYLVPKGSVTLDGVSLTVVEVIHDGFSVALIPHTLGVTTLGNLDAGARVNVELDVLAKYVARFLEAPAASEALQPAAVTASGPAKGGK